MKIKNSFLRFSNKETRGQVTIFIVFSIVVVLGILIIVFFSGKISIGSDSGGNPKDIVKKCIKDSVKTSVNKMLKNGGEILPSKEILYEGDEWNYLCYQADYYQSCYNIHPMLESQIEKEIVRDSKERVSECFTIMIKNFKDKGYDVSDGALDYSVDLLPGYINIILSKRVEISREDGSQVFEDFSFDIISSLYDLIKVARDVVNSESQFCHFEYNGYMLLYPRFDIRRFDYVDSKMYRLIDRRSGDEFRFAVRSCAYAPGI
jgi:hypothetical protein